MERLLLMLGCCMLFNCSVYAQQQVVGLATDAAALSPNEMPSFNEYKLSPENIKISAVAASELHALIERKDKMIILDARNKEEYDVSRLPNAKRIGFDDFMVERVWMIDRNAKVIIYSFTGKRGLIVAQYMKIMGFRYIYVLEGNLVAWKNSGELVYDANKAVTEKVHVGPKENVALLKKGEAIHY